MDMISKILKGYAGIVCRDDACYPRTQYIYTAKGWETNYGYIHCNGT